jgi:hypothetical protein
VDASVGSQTHAAYKAEAAIPRIRRSVILRAIDRRAIASESVTLGNSGTMDGAAKSIGDAAGFALTDALAWEESSIERPLRTGPSMDSGPLSIESNRAKIYVSTKRPI